MCRTNEGGQAGKNMASPRLSRNGLSKKSIIVAGCIERTRVVVDCAVVVCSARALTKVRGAAVDAGAAVARAIRSVVVADGRGADEAGSSGASGVAIIRTVVDVVEAMAAVAEVAVGAVV